MIFINQSRIKAWRRCHRLHFYKFVLKLRRKVKNKSFLFGSLIHEMLETGNAGKSVEPILKAYDKALKKNFFKEELAEEGLDNLIDDSRFIYNFYQEYYKNDGLEYVAIEQYMEVPINNDFGFKGTLDAIVDDDEDREWLFERKSCKTMPEERIRASDIQTVLYAHFLPQVKRTGRKFWRKPYGVIWDYVRSKRPSIPHQNKNGELSRAAIDTVPSVFLAEIKRLGLNPKDYKEIIASLQGNEINFLQRIKLPLSKHVEAEVVSDFMQTAAEIVERGDMKDRNLSFECARCEFYSLCQAELRGADTDFLLKREYEEEPDEKDNKKRNILA